MSIAPTNPITAADLRGGYRFDLVESHLAQSVMESFQIAAKIFYQIESFLVAHPLGRVLPEVSRYQCFPDNIRMARKSLVSYFRAGRLQPEQFEQGTYRIAPDLAVEVVSPNDLHTDLTRKLEDYFSAGVPLVWVVEPELRLVTVYENGGKSIRQVREGEELSAGDVLPGFHVPIVELFPKASQTTTS